MKRKYWLAGGAITVLLLTIGFQVKRLHDEGHGALTWAGAAKALSQSREERRRRFQRDYSDLLKRSKEWSQRLVATHPELQIQYRDVPDDRNGLLQLMLFLNSPGIQGLNTPEINHLGAMLSGDEEWDAARSEKILEGHAPLLDQLEAIGRLPDESCKGLDRGSIISKNIQLSNLTKMLSARAQMEMDSGNSTKAADSFQALVGLSRHLNGNEAPCCLDSLIAESIRAQLNRQMEHAMASAKTPEEFRQWQSFLEPAETPDPAAILRGDWDAAAGPILLPAMLGDPSQGFSPSLAEQPEATGEMLANMVSAQIRDAKGKTAMDWCDPAMKTHPFPDYEIPSQVPAEAREQVEKIQKCGVMCIQNMTSYTSMRAMQQAAAAIALGEEPPVDPVTGEDFLVDREAGTVSIPKDHPGGSFQSATIPKTSWSSQAGEKE